MKKMLMGAVATAALMMTAGVAMAQAPAPSTALTTHEIKPGFYVVEGNGGNTSVRVGKDGLIVVDTKNPGGHDDLVKSIKAISPLPVKEVVITHHHADHAGGIGEFEKDGATVTTNVGLKAQLDKGYTAANNFKPSQPSKTYDKTAEVKVGGASAKLYHFDPGHTGGDTLVYFPDVKILAGGDEVNAGTPNIDFPFGGSLLGLQDSLAQADKLDFDTVVPGHGAVTMTRAEYEAYRKKIDTVIARGRAAIKAGTPKEGLLAAIKTDDLGWNLATPQWNAPARLDVLYAELSK